MADEVRVAIASDADLVTARAEARAMAERLGFPRPDPTALVLALADLSHDDPSQAAMIGDSAADVMAGKGEGVVTIAVLWGVPDHTDLLAAGPDVVCESVDDLRAAVGLA